MDTLPKHGRSPAREGGPWLGRGLEAGPALNNQLPRRIPPGLGTKCSGNLFSGSAKTHNPSLLPLPLGLGEP